MELLTKKDSGWSHFKEQLKEVLREANISFRQVIVFGCLVVFLLIGLIILVYKGPTLWQWGKTFLEKKKQIETVVEQVKEPISKVIESGEQITKKILLSETQRDFSKRELLAGALLGEDVNSGPPIKDYFDSGLKSGVIVGSSPFTGGKSYLSSREVLTSVILGGGVVFADTLTSLERAIIQLRKLSNSLEVDVKVRLEQIIPEEEKKAYLEAELLTMKEILDESRASYDELGEEMENLKAEADSLTAEIKAEEKAFFENLNILSSDVSNENLESFVDLSQRQTEAKSRFKALNEIRTRFVTPFRALENRVKAIDLNKEALIKGIKVVEVGGESLDLVIKEKPKK